MATIKSNEFIFCQPEETSEIFIKLEQLLIILSEKVIYGEVFDWLITLTQCIKNGAMKKKTYSNPKDDTSIAKRNFPS